MAHKYKPAAAQKTTARNRKQLHGTENSCTEQKAAARNRKLLHGTESCCTEQKIRLLRGINTRIPATRNTLSPTARNTLSPRADIATARHRKLLRHGIESCCGTEQKAAAARHDTESCCGTEQKAEDLFLYNFVVQNVFCQYLYNIALQNTDFGVLQKSSKHFLIIYIFFPPLSFRTPCPPPPSKK